MDRERFQFNRNLNFPWLVKMAIRDSRRNRSRLLLFISSIILGIAAWFQVFIRIQSEKDIDAQAKELVGRRPGGLCEQGARQGSEKST
jgi:putative ABC transport system permease protein